MWCFAMACPHAADRVMEMVCSPDWRDEAALVLNLCGAQCLDIVLRDMVSGIRSEIYRRNKRWYTQDGISVIRQRYLQRIR